jgi:4-amino-4-deoxy-L-arabinose transferase-like glycosyltransferase
LGLPGGRGSEVSSLNSSREPALAGTRSVVRGPRSPRLALLALAGVLLVAGFFRLWRLDSVPRGLSHDEANNGLMAKEVLDGYHPVFFEIYTGVEPGLIYPQAMAFWLLGAGALTERLVSVSFGLLTVALTYVLANRLFRSWLVALFSSLLVAISFWQVFVSRLALRAVTMPALEILTLYFFWRGLESRRLRDWALAGFFGGLAMYTYLSSRFLPFIPALFILYLLVRRENLRSAWTGMGLMLGVWLMVSLPLGIYYVQNPHWFLFRAEQALVLSQPADGTGLSPLLRETLATLGMFSFRGDPSWRYNLAGRPVFDWAIALAFYVGLGVSLWRALKPPRLNPYAFILVTQVVMLVPDFITDGSPHFLRTIGTVPTTFIFPAIALAGLYELIRPRWRYGLVAVVSLWAAWVSYSTYHDYFQVWAVEPEARSIYNASLAEIADYLSVQDGGVARIASSSPDLDRVAFDLSANDEPPGAQWFDGTQALIFPGSAGQTGHYFLPSTVTMPNALRSLLPADGVEQVPAPDGSVSFEVIPLGTTPVPQHPLKVTLGELVQIAGYDQVNPEIQAGQPLELRIYWRVMTNPDPRRRWTWFVHLMDRRGYEWANWTGQGFEVADWLPGEDVVQVAPLSIPFDAPGIEYHLEIGVYDQISGERLTTAGGSDLVALNGIRVSPAEPDSIAPLIAEHTRGQLGEQLAYLGSTLSTRRAVPGADLTLTLAWAPASALAEDWTFHLQLIGEDGAVAYEMTWAPLGGEFPTSSWPSGRITRDVVVLSIPADIDPGRYQLIVSAMGLDGSVRTGRLQILPGGGP